MRRGRLALASGGDDFGAVQVAVIPNDGSEPIEIPVVSVVARGAVGNWTDAEITIRGGITRLDLMALEEDEVLHVWGSAEDRKRPALAHDLRVRDAETGEQILATGFVWVFTNTMRRARMYLKGRRDPSS